MLLLGVLAAALCWGPAGAARGVRGARGAGGARPRVIAGLDAPAGGPPFVVALTRNLSRSCTGSLISDRWVLTAAHCITLGHCTEYGIVYKQFTVLPSNNKYVRKAKRCYRHPSFSMRPEYIRLLHLYHSNDIGLMMVDRKVTDIQKLGKISAVDFRSLIGRSVKYFGFGRTTPDSEHFKINKKQEMALKAKDAVRPLQRGEAVVARCSAQDEAESEPSPFICIRPKCSKVGQQIQSGDSGGPLIFKGKIVGVLTGKVAFQHYSAFYTATSPFLSWITHTIAVATTNAD